MQSFEHVDETNLFTSLLSPGSDHVIIHLGGSIVFCVHTPVHSVACDKLPNWNLPIQMNRHMV